MNAVLHPSRRRISVEEFFRMDEAGIFGPEERVELLDGEIYAMPPIGSHHSGVLTRIDRMIRRGIGDQYLVQLQNPVKISLSSLPQPDLVVLKHRDDDYIHATATVDDVLLLVEVADSSLRFDRKLKSPLYNAAGITEFWIVNIVDRCIESYPSGQRHGLGDIARARGCQRLEIDVTELFRPLIEKP
jgi:Uma2 family endonuclease